MSLNSIINTIYVYDSDIIVNLFGGNGNDILNGSFWGDTFNSSLGADTYNGFGGMDTARYAGSNAAVTVNLATGQGSGGTAAGDRYISIENATGSNYADRLIGNSGANALDGGTGADTMEGGAGDDTYFVDNVGDKVIEANAARVDLVNSSITFSLFGLHIENLTLIGSANINGTGNELANIINGGSGNNTLDGKGGADTMAGKAGNDIYAVNHVGDIVIELANEGIDTVWTSGISYTLTANVENLNLGGGNFNGTGNNLANIINGGSGNNTLDGKGGADTMAGKAGNDIYAVNHVGDIVIELANEGIDTVWTSGISYTLTANVENLNLGGGNFNGAGNILANIIKGGSGNNVIDGKGGADTMQGGLGDDTYYVDHVGDIVIEESGAGADIVYSSVSFNLAGQHIEYLTLTGGAAINATGNSLGNSLVGNSGANILSGLGGVDTLIGREGDDTLTGGDGADNFLFDLPLNLLGVDTITDFTPNSDRLVLARVFFAEIGAALDDFEFLAVNGGQATTLNHRIIYDLNNGNLYWDGDGSGGAQRILFAKLTPGLALDNLDFIMF